METAVLFFLLYSDVMWSVFHPIVSDSEPYLTSCISQNLSMSVYSLESEAEKNQKNAENVQHQLECDIADLKVKSMLND